MYLQGGAVIELRSPVIRARLLIKLAHPAFCSSGTSAPDIEISGSLAWTGGRNKIKNQWCYKTACQKSKMSGEIRQVDKRWSLPEINEAGYIGSDAVSILAPSWVVNIAGTWHTFWLVLFKGGFVGGRRRRTRRLCWHCETCNVDKRMLLMQLMDDNLIISWNLDERPKDAWQGAAAERRGAMMTRKSYD